MSIFDPRLPYLFLENKCLYSNDKINAEKLNVVPPKEFNEAGIDKGSNSL